jgi:exodeoxyribonuclease VII small subunit
MARRKSSTEEDTSAPSFEEALGKLESIVEAMENESLPLEDLVTHYEQGFGLLTHCESILQAARSRIELITLRNQPEIGLDAPVKSMDAAHDSASDPDLDDSDDDDNDIRLF